MLCLSRKRIVITKDWPHGLGHSIPMFKSQVWRPLGYPGTLALGKTYFYFTDSPMGPCYACWFPSAGVFQRLCWGRAQSIVFQYKVVQTQPNKFWYICDFSQWHKLSVDVITRDMKTNSPNHLQICSQLWKAHVPSSCWMGWEWVFWHIIKVNTTKII